MKLISPKIEKVLPFDMRFYKAVQFRLQVDQAIPAKTIGIMLVHIRPLFRGDHDPETLALRDVPRFAGKGAAASRAITGLMITHVFRFI
jgi:hypothetical protein